MSEQLTSQSCSNESGITRRTALRGAAWSASAVTVVVATPNIAAASVIPVPPKGSASGSVTRSSGNGEVFTFNTTLKNTGTTAFTNPTVVISWNGQTRTFSLGSSLASGGNGVRLPKVADAAVTLGTSQGGTVTMAFYPDAPSGTPLHTLTFANVGKGATVTIPPAP